MSDAAPSVPCRSCGEIGLQSFLDLGTTPLADALVRPEWLDHPEYHEGFHPLEVAFCPSCALVQILEEVSAESMFVDNYLYFSSFSDALLAHSRAHALGLIDERGLNEHSFVVELASNDGYLLKNFVAAGIPVLGIDPAPEPAAAAIQAGVPTLQEFFTTALAEKIVEDRGHASVIIANNVMAHVPDLNGFVAGMAVLLADDGVITVENPQVGDLIDHGEFDTVYHEHYCYYSCHSVEALMRRHGMFLNHVDYFPDLHGGTYRWWISKQPGRSADCERIMDRERAVGITDFAYYEAFGQRVEQMRAELVALLRARKAAGRTIAAYGAAAKGSTLVNYCGLGTDLIDFVVDRNVHKHGKLMPGVHIPIRPVEALLEDRPDDVLLLAWNFTKEIRAQQQDYEAGGGTFITPVPRPTVLD